MLSARMSRGVSKASLFSAVTGSDVGGEGWQAISSAAPKRYALFFNGLKAKSMVLENLAFKLLKSIKPVIAITLVNEFLLYREL